MTIGMQGASQVAAGDKLIAAQISSDVGFLLAELRATGSVLNNVALAEFDLKERSYSALILANSGLEPTQRELADFLSLDPSQIVALVDELEKRGAGGQGCWKAGPQGKDRDGHGKGGPSPGGGGPGCATGGG
jgi:hypothetical protein